MREESSTGSDQSCSIEERHHPRVGAGYIAAVITAGNVCPRPNKQRSARAMMTSFQMILWQVGRNLAPTA